MLNVPYGWKKISLGTIGDVAMCKRILKQQTNNIKGVPFYKIGTFGVVADAYIDNELFQHYKTKYPYPNVGDVLISAAGTIGRLVVFNGEEAYFQDSNIVWLQNDEKIVLNRYLYYLYQTIKWQTSEGGIVSRLYNNAIRQTVITLPPIEEQKKIAGILGTWDRAIEELTRLIAEKKELKRGLMQRLLTGSQRLPGFTKPWDNIKLVDIAQITTAISKSQYIKEIGPYLIVDMGAVSNEATLIAKKQTDYEGDFLVCDDLIMPKDDIGGGNIIGKTIVIDCDNKYILGDHVFKIRVTDEYDAKFISSLINSFEVNKYMRRVSTGSAQLGLAKRDVEKCMLFMPVDLAEQKAIADVLSKADAEIDLLNQQLDVLKEQKRGLMQKLLTGEIRVKVDDK